jgi:opacity protein-like surface antigen
MLLVFPAVAAAQERGYVQGLAGVARGVETDSVYGGIGAWRIGDRLEIFGEVARLRNALGPDLRDRLAAIETAIRDAIAAQFGTTFPVAFEPRVPVWYGLGGVRVRGPAVGRLSTYLEGGLGAARLDPQVHLTINGEPLDAEAAAITGLGDERQQLEFIAGGGGGVAFQVWRRIRIEGGYRYTRLFGDARTNLNRVHVGAGWTF